MAGKRVTEVYLSGYGRHIDRDGEPVLVVSAVIWGGRGGNTNLGRMERTISVTDLAAQLFGDDLPKVGDLLDGPVS